MLERIWLLYASPAVGCERRSRRDLRSFSGANRDVTVRAGGAAPPVMEHHASRDRERPYLGNSSGGRDDLASFGFPYLPDEL
jgi:hypothetical protein